jgi:hypothetical protein
MPELEHLVGAGLSLGDLYIVSSKKVTEIIPKSHISYVSASYNHHPALILLGIILFLFGIFGFENSNQNQALYILSIFFSAIFFVTYFVSRKVGIVIASSGGKIFVETRGRHRSALIDKIRENLSTGGESNLLESSPPTPASSIGAAEGP